MPNVSGVIQHKVFLLLCRQKDTRVFLPCLAADADHRQAAVGQAGRRVVVVGRVDRRVVVGQADRRRDVIGERVKSTSLVLFTTPSYKNESLCSNQKLNVTQP